MLFRSQIEFYGSSLLNAGNGAPNTGGGGGGASLYYPPFSYNMGGDGGSGIVIIRYLFLNEITIKKWNFDFSFFYVNFLFFINTVFFI